ncbi:MAG: Ldh family oxidoreductase [Burkholderiales bacterium]
MATKSGVRVGDYRQLESFAAALFIAKGMRADDAATLARVLVWADLRGTASHGVSRVQRYMEMVAAGELDTQARVAIEEKGASLLLMRASRAAGPISMTAMAEAAAERADKTGSCIGIVSLTTHTGAIGVYAEWLAKRGFASIIAASGPPMMAYHGARVPSLSTSPIAMGVPRGDSPLILDMATSVVPMQRLLQAKKGETELEPGWALDKNGDPTTDAAAAKVAMPLGGPKGSGLSLMIECLTGLMAGTPILAATIGPSGDGRHRQNALMVVIKVAALCDPADYARDIEKLSGAIKGLKPRTGFDEILLPGERGARASAKNRKEGVPVSAAAWRYLEELAPSLGVELPPVT